MSPETFAERFFAASDAFSTMESEIFEKLWEIVPEDSFDDYAADHYDDSIELIGCVASFEPTDDQLRGLLGLGFTRGWICWADGTEIMFGPRAGESGVVWRGPRKSSIRGRQP